MKEKQGIGELLVVTPGEEPGNKNIALQNEHTFGKVKITLEEPVIVAAGPTFEEVGWGPWQFPQMQRTEEGKLILNWHNAADLAKEFGGERIWVTSRDDGETWQRVSAEELLAVKARSGTKLPSGKYLRYAETSVVRVSDEMAKTFRKKRIQWAQLKQDIHGYDIVNMEDIPDGLIPKYQVPVVMCEADSYQEEMFYSQLDFPGMVTMLTQENDLLIPMLATYGTSIPKVAPDGSIWTAYYNVGRDPENLGSFGHYYACFVLQSKDEGRSFRLKACIPYKPDTKKYKNSYLSEGFTEPDIEFMPDGSMIMILRSGNGLPTYLSRSTDGGNTWSDPEIFDRCGVQPRLLHLKNGVTLATYGRPGRILRATADPSGQVWDKPYVLQPYEHIYTSCYYTWLVALDDNTALMAYTDWTVKDEEGVERKTILVQKIHTEIIK